MSPRKVGLLQFSDIAIVDSVIHENKGCPSTRLARVFLFFQKKFVLQIFLVAHLLDPKVFSQALFGFFLVYVDLSFETGIRSPMGSL